jgi:hypothetical protein
MEKPRSWRRWPPLIAAVLLLAATVLILAATVLILAPLSRGTSADERALNRQIAALEATREALSTDVAELGNDLQEGKLQGADGSNVALTEAAASPSPTRTPQPTATRTPTATPAPTNTPLLPRLNLTLLGCSTGLDITHGFGEVTNAYVRVQNVGEVLVTDVCARLEASDVGETHPDEERCVPVLPAQTQVSLRLTADTEFRAASAIAVHLTSDEGASDIVTAASCRKLDLPLKREVEDALDFIEPLPPD